MRTFLAGLVTVCLFCGVAAAQKSAFTSRETAKSPVDNDPGREAAPATAAVDPVEKALAGLDLRGRVCQIMMVTLEGGYRPSVNDLAYLRSYTPGAVILRQVRQPGNAAAYVARVRSLEGVSGIPIWVGANLAELAKRERGARSAFVQLPSPLAVGATRDDGCIDKLGLIMAANMKRMGFDLHLGPAFYLAPTLSDAPGTLRIFGSDPAWVARAGMRVVDRFAEEGVMAVPMGFPGGGADRIGRGEAVLLTPRMHLAEMDLVPYAAAVSANVPALHVGPTHVTGLDPGAGPACVSEVVIREILRGELGYRGVVIAGPMDSSDVATRLNPVEAAVRALQYGADMIYWRGAGQIQIHAVERIVQAVGEGLIPSETLDRAVRRVLACKFAQRINVREKVDERAAARLENRKDLVRDTFAIERKSITLVKNAGGILPLTKAKAMPVGVTGVVGVEPLRDALEKYMKPVSEQAINSARYLGDIQDFEIQRLTSHIRGIRTVVCVLTDQLRVPGMVRLVRALKDAGTRVVVVFLGYPAALAELDDADAMVAAYCDSATYDQSLLAVAEILVGEGAIALPPRSRPLTARVGEPLTYDIRDVAHSPTGKLPVRVGDVFPAGWGLRYDPSAGIKSVEWRFGDGGKRKGDQVTHAYKAPGEYRIRVRLTDKRKQTSEQTFNMVVEPREGP